MYYFFSLLTGILISIMISFNGGLTTKYGAYTATIIVHITGLALISAILLVRREKPLFKKQAGIYYLGGMVGVLTTICNNLAFGHISVSAILALGLFGQSVAGLIYDHYGLMGMPRYPFKKRKILGLSLILCGILSMIPTFQLFAVLVSFISGICIVVSRTLNAKLSEHTNVQISTFFNFLMGLLVSIPVFFLFGRNENGFTNLTISSNVYIYLGGIVGVGVILLSNITVNKVSAFSLSLFIFIGQVFTGILIDTLISNAFSYRNLIGGILVSAGLIVNLLMDNERFSPKNG